MASKQPLAREYTGVHSEQNKVQDKERSSMGVNEKVMKQNSRRIAPNMGGTAKKGGGLV